MQLLFEADDTVGQLLVDKLSLLHVSCHPSFQLLEGHQGRVRGGCLLAWDRRHSLTIFVLVNVDHLIGSFKLVANLKLKVLDYVRRHRLLLKLSDLSSLLLNDL